MAYMGSRYVMRNCYSSDENAVLCGWIILVALQATHYAPAYRKKIGYNNKILFSVFNSSLLIEVEQAGSGRELSNGSVVVCR